MSLARKLLLTVCTAAATGAAQQSSASSAVTALPEIRRIYVGELVGEQGDTLRQLIISSLNSTNLFVITDNVERADAVLKGAADDKVFTESLDIQEGIGARESAGKYSSGNSIYSRGSGGYGGLSITDSQSHHSKDRKHEAFASVRLCNRDGDVLWSTTQESLGAKFRGASADVAYRVAHQLALDLERARKTNIEPAAKAPSTSVQSEQH
jgi:hypothetical protein